MMFCTDCDKQIDLDFDADHFDEHRSLDDVMSEEVN